MPGSADALLDQAALLVAVAGLLALALGVARTRSLQPGLGMALDLFLAAGLLRLAGDPSYQQLLVAALVLAVRRLAGGALRQGVYHHVDS